MYLSTFAHYLTQPLVPNRHLQLASVAKVCPLFGAVVHRVKRDAVGFVRIIVYIIYIVDLLRNLIARMGGWIRVHLFGVVPMFRSC